MYTKPQYIMLFQLWKEDILIENTSKCKTNIKLTIEITNSK